MFDSTSGELSLTVLFAELLTFDVLYNRFDYQIENESAQCRKADVHEDFLQGKSACLIIQSNAGVSPL